MKVETNHKTEFKPIELKITIESKEELATLVCHLNCSTNTIKEYRPDFVSGCIDVSLKYSRELWLKLEQLYKSC